ncbi:MAG: cyclopropane fatty acyl phospholipid synthase [Desulforhopalus sp.]
MRRIKQTVQSVLEPLDIQIDGRRPWDLRVHNPEFYKRVLSGGSLALGESYMERWWDCDALDQFFEKILENRFDRKIRSNRALLWEILKTRLKNAQTRNRAFIVARRHYDIGDDLFRMMLDKWLNYSCGYWHNAETLDQAQEAKLHLICRKLGLQPGMTVLDIGCGWGGFAKFAAMHYRVRVKGVTVSRKQIAFAREFCKNLDVQIELCDYRDLYEPFDRVVSIGMFEHVGWRNYRTFMSVVHRCLKKNGIFLLHTIAGNTSVTATDPWIDKYIFPNSMMPSASQISEAAEGLFLLEDWHSFGPYYDKTLMVWFDNFTKNWKSIKGMYDQTFYRMWTYYLLLCAASFRARRNQLWQIVFSKGGMRQVFCHKADFSHDTVSRREESCQAACS